MKKTFYFIAAAVLTLGLASCANAEKMAKQAENVKVVCTPATLAVKGGKVEADVAVTCPQNYFHPKAILEVIPVIVYEGGEEPMEALMFQGEKVKNNYRVVRKVGGVINQHLCFPYKEGMAKSYLEFRARCSVDGGKKWVTLPVKKVADGCNITENLASRGFYDYKDSGYQEILTLRPEGQVMYQVNSSIVRNSELNNDSVKEFLKAINEIYGNDREKLKSIDVVAYASPEGTEDFNEKLSKNRSHTAENAFQKITKDEELDGVYQNVKSVGEDWEGFKEMVKNSNIEDKDLILRVLSMYSDPRIRESEIRNMSSIFQDLAKDVLPQLRRARFIANVEYRNYSNAELQDLVSNDIDILDESALLKAAEIATEKADKKALYDKAIEKFNSETARFNLAVLSLGCNKCANLEEATKYIGQCDTEDPEVINIKGIIEVYKGNLDEAEKIFKSLEDNENAVRNLGFLELLRGNYTTAILKIGNKGVDAGVAYLLAGNVNMAYECVKDCNCPVSNYFRAICLNRMGKTAEAKEALKLATDACQNLAKRAANDIEFSNL